MTVRYRMPAAASATATPWTEGSNNSRPIIAPSSFITTISGLSLSEIANALDIPVGTAKSRLHHARLALRDAIGTDAQRPEGHIA
jgi:Sigma-70, region 4